MKRLLLSQAQKVVPRTNQPPFGNWGLKDGCRVFTAPGTVGCTAYLARSVRDLRPFPSAPREFAARSLLERLARRATGGRLGVYIARPREPRPRSVPHRSPCTSRWPRSGISRRFPLRRAAVNSGRVHPEDSPDGYLPVGQAILPLAPVIRALVQYRAALQRRSLHRAWRGVVTLVTFVSHFLDELW